MWEGDAVREGDRERERKRERKRDIYICIERKREKKNKYMKRK